MKTKNMLRVIIIAVLFSATLFNACSPLREFGKMPVYNGNNNFDYQLPGYDSLKKTVIIIADNDGTELFDMMAPYYLFNNTGKANVYIVAEKKYPIVVKKGFFLLPQFTFAEVDSLQINPDVIVIPNLSGIDSLHQNPLILDWIKKHYAEATTILSVCDGSMTAAATGIFDGRPITAHASDYPGIKKQFSRPLWINNISVANSGNLYSTAGVSNAVEGSLLVINKIFGPEEMQRVRDNIKYPYQFPKTQHQSITFDFGNKMSVGKKIIFRKNKRIGVLLQDSINEFDLAAIMDTYNRSFPKSIQSFSVNDAVITTKYGLKIIPTGKIKNIELDELHIVDPLLFSGSKNKFSHSVEMVNYTKTSKKYIIDECLQRISGEYGKGFENIVKLMLDYN